MSDVLSSQPAPRTAAEYKAVIAQLLAEMHRLNEQMRQDQTDIDRLKVETNVLKAETQRLKAEARAALARLGEMV